MLVKPKQLVKISGQRFLYKLIEAIINERAKILKFSLGVQISRIPFGFYIIWTVREKIGPVKFGMKAFLPVKFNFFLNNILINLTF